MIPASVTTDGVADQMRSLLSDLESIELLQRLEGVHSADLARIERHYRQLLEAIQNVAASQAARRNSSRRRSDLPRASSMLPRATPARGAKTHAVAPQPRSQPSIAQERRPILLPTPTATRDARQREKTPNVEEDAKPIPAPPVPSARSDSAEPTPSATPVAPWKQKAPVEEDTMLDLRIGGRRALLPQPREPGEWTIRARWWNAPLAAAVALVVIVGLVAISVEMARFEGTCVQLTHELRKADLDETKTRTLTAVLLASPLGRWDAQRDYLAALATWRMAKREDAGATQTIARFLRRSVQKAPASPWRHVSLAAMSSPEVLRNDLPSLRRIAWNEPDALAAMASALDRANLDEEAEECLSRLLVLDPVRSGEVVRQRLDQHLSFEKALAIVPTNIVAIAEVTEIAKPWNEKQLRRWVELQLTQIPKPASNDSMAGNSGRMTTTAELSAWDRVRNWSGSAGVDRDALRPESLKAN